MAIVRSADMNRTPDVRTRAILPRWACQITISYAIPLLKEAQITNLLAAAGFTVGIGDYRQEKGKGSYGQYSLVAPDDANYRDIMENELPKVLKIEVDGRRPDITELDKRWGDVLRNREEHLNLARAHFDIDLKTVETDMRY